METRETAAGAPAPVPAKRGLTIFGVPQREVRLGVTMVGGTSLAIYENGVAQELYRLARGRGAYGLIKQLTHSHILIDVLSGTSAGGINNIFLATALAAGKDLSVTKNTWIAQGGIGDLMQDPLQPEVGAILQGNDYYQKEALARGFRQIFAADARQPSLPFERPLADIPSPGDGGPTAQELDLFVTGTFHNGMPFTFYDARNQPLATRSYRGIFHLEHRPTRGESHFDPALREPGETKAPELPRPARVQERLTRIARTTSSLPAVFEPSRVEQDLMGGVIRLPQPVSFMLDGGSLNNRPINLSLEAIYRRSARREVVRKMILVEPDPELREKPDDEQEEKARLKTGPDALQNVLHFLRTPLYQSLVADLEQLEEHNRRVRQLNNVLERVKRETVRPEGTRRDGPSPQQHQIWVSVLLDNLTRQLVELWEMRLGVRRGADAPGEDDAPARTRERREAHAAALRAIAPRLAQRLEDSCLDTHASAAEPFRLLQIDAGLVERKAYRAIYDLYEALYPTPATTTNAAQQGDMAAVMAECGPRLAFRDYLRTMLQSAGDAEAQGVSAWDRLGQTMSGWFQFVRLAEIVNGNVASVCIQIATPDPRTGEWVYGGAAASEAEAERSARTIWTALRGALRALLALPETLEGAPGLLRDLRAAAAGAAPAGPPRPITPEELSAFERYLGDRAETVCKNLMSGVYNRSTDAAPTDADVSASEAARVAALEAARVAALEAARVAALEVAEAETPTIVTAASRLIDQQVAWAARTLAPAYGGWEQWPLAWAAVSLNAPGEAAAIVAERADRLDAYLFPIEHTSGLISRDEIALVRISPVDSQAEYAEENPEFKVAGDAALNLGAFFKRSWRANDILWGRLDAANALVDTLLEPARLAELLQYGAGDVEKDAMRAALYDTLGVAPAEAGNTTGPLRGLDRIGAFLIGGDRFAGEMRALNAFLADPKGPAGDAALKALRALVLRRLHLEILMEELPQALAEALSEQAEWSARRQDDGSLPLVETDRVAEVTGAVDTKLADAPAADRTTREIWRARAKARVTRDLGLDDPAQVDKQFKRDYQIGQELIARNIPPLVLLQQSLGALLILVHLLQHLMRGSDQGGRNPVADALSRFLLRPIGWIARLLYLFVTAMAQGPTISLVVQSALWTIALGLGITALARMFAGAEAGAWFGNLLISVGALVLIALYSTLRRKRVRQWLATTLVIVVVLVTLVYQLYPAVVRIRENLVPAVARAAAAFQNKK